MLKSLKELMISHFESLTLYPCIHTYTLTHTHTLTNTLTYTHTPCLLGKPLTGGGVPPCRSSGIKDPKRHPYIESFSFLFW